MAAETFAWVPVFGGGSSVKPRVRSVSFGDGYGQSIPDGINTISRSRQVTFQESPAVCDGIEDFLARHAGVRWFWFAYPGAARIKVKCKEWSRQHPQPGQDVIAATFEQCFDPGV